MPWNLFWQRATVGQLDGKTRRASIRTVDGRVHPEYAAVKLAIGGNKVVLTVNNPDSGSAEEEVACSYEADPLDIGFNSRYLLDIAAQIEGEVAVLKLADPGSPTLLRDKDAPGALYVLMPMRV